MKSFIPRRYFEDNQKTGAAKLTVQKFYLPNGFSTQNKGVLSDVALPSVDDLLPFGESDLPNAMVWDTIRPARFTGFSIQPELLSELRERSLDRQSTLEEFQFLNRRIEWFKEKQEQKAISLNLENRRTQKVIDEAFKEEMDSEQTILADLNFDSTEHLLDSVLKNKVSEEETEEEIEDTGEDTVEGIDLAEEDTDDDPPRFDIHLRESLRILADALDYSPDPRDWAEIETLTAQRESANADAVR